MEVVQKFFTVLFNALRDTVNNFANPPQIVYGPGTNVLGIDWNFWGPAILVVIFFILSVMKSKFK